MYTDMVSDYNFILGDLNYRFKSTYTDFIDKIENAPSLLSLLDELCWERNQEDRLKYPQY